MLHKKKQVNKYKQGTMALFVEAYIQWPMFDFRFKAKLVCVGSIRIAIC